MPRDLIEEVYVDSQIVAWLRSSLRRLQNGWLQRNAISERRPGRYAYCMSGAIIFNDNGKSVITPINRVQQIAEAMLLIAVCKLTRDSTTSIVKFNDDWHRTKADCEQAFEVAIELQIRKERMLGLSDAEW